MNAIALGQTADEAIAAIESSDGTIVLRELPSGALLSVIPVGSEVLGLVFTQENLLVAACPLGLLAIHVVPTQRARELPSVARLD